MRAEPLGLPSHGWCRDFIPKAVYAIDGFNTALACSDSPFKIKILCELEIVEGNDYFRWMIMVDKMG